MKKSPKETKKNITSDIINNNIPQRNPEETELVWLPEYKPSRITSRHHWNIVINTKIIPINKQNKPLPLNQNKIPIVVIIAPKDPIKGQGLISTRWKGCRTI